jgi:hypothetical protein
MEYGDNTKKIVFYDTDKRHADLRIRLQYDEMSQNEFFRALITGYIKKDSRITSYIYEWRNLNKGYSEAKRVKSEKLLQNGKELGEKFGLDENEIENIFDILEEHRPDL